jgi:hypothetical protein
MLKILRTLFLLGAVVFLVSVGLALISYAPNHYMAAGRDKYNRLYSTPSPRIILVGGSNVAFGLDSEKIETHFGVPVINMGLAAGLGLKFMIHEIQPALQDGDVVILMPEYEQFYSLPLEGRSSDLGAAAKYCPECFLTSNVVDDPQQLALATAGIFQGIEGDLLAAFEPRDKIHSRQGFNRQGDMIAHLDQTDTPEILNSVLPVNPRQIDPAVEFLNSFQRSGAGKNARIFLTFPSIPAGEYYAQRRKFAALHELLQTKLEIPILGAPADFVYPIELFYDTVYHLNAIGRAQRTERLIELLAPALEK